MIKAAFFDIDGTLVGFSQKVISDAVIAALERLRAGGIKLFISSGRPKMLITNLKDFPFDGYITMNGAKAEVDGEVILRNPISREDAMAIAVVSEKNNIPCVAFSDDISGINTENEVTAEVNRLLHIGGFPHISLTELAASSPIYQYTIYASGEQVERYYVPATSHISFPRWHPLFLDAIPEFSSKAVAVQAIMDLFGYTRDEIIAFGDGENDAEMLRLAGTSVAMGSASDYVKDLATYVAGDADNNGILGALEHFGLI